MKQGLRAITALASAAILAGCGAGIPAQAPPPTEDPRQQDATRGTLGDLFGGGSLFGGRGAVNDTGMSVNRHLWLASLDTMSFLPLASTDPFSGVIATDWSTTADAPGERVKVTVYISDPALAATSLRVAVFRELLDPSGVWVAADVSEATPRRLEDAILTRARQMRVSELETSRRS